MTTSTENTLGLLAPWRRAGLLAAGDVHVAETLCRLGGEDRPQVILAVALAARAPRLAHVCVDLADVAESATESSDDAPALDWPDTTTWLEEVAGSPLVATPEQPDNPLVMQGTLLYLQRYFRYEADVAAQLVRRSASVVPDLQPAPDVLDLLLPGPDSQLQRQAVHTALSRALTVLVGGPGTGKTTSVAAVLATLAATDPTLRIALAAPTGKAAARLGEAVRSAASHVPGPLAEVLGGVEASTLHRLLGVHGGGGFRHHADRLLPHDVVIIDETSMVSLPLMAALLDAVRPDSRLVLVGDADQLVSVQAGTVLGDIAASAAPGSSLAPCVARLQISRRFPPGSPIDRLATAVRQGDADAVLSVLAEGNESLEWDPRRADTVGARSRVMDLVEGPTREVTEHAEAGAALEALSSLEGFRLLCAHRRGPFGVQQWNQHVEQALARSGRTVTGWYAGRPLLVTANDAALGVFNGDLGVVVDTGSGRPMVAFPGSVQPRLLSPARLPDVETVHATTIHKSQGSEFDHVVVVLPPSESPLATRELIYTAITRARHRVTLVGDEAAVRAAVSRPVRRAGGLRQALLAAESALFVAESEG